MFIHTSADTVVHSAWRRAWPRGAAGKETSSAGGRSIQTGVQVLGQGDSLRVERSSRICCETMITSAPVRSQLRTVTTTYSWTQGVNRPKTIKDSDSKSASCDEWSHRKTPNIQVLIPCCLNKNSTPHSLLQSHTSRADHHSGSAQPPISSCAGNTRPLDHDCAPCGYFGQCRS